MLSINEILTCLNALNVGRADRVAEELERVRAALSERDQAELAELVGRASEALVRGEIAEFRRCVATVTSRLGHLK